MELESEVKKRENVALFTRAWIEIWLSFFVGLENSVALFTRAWIEILHFVAEIADAVRRPLHEGVD